MRGELAHARALAPAAQACSQCKFGIEKQARVVKFADEWNVSYKCACLPDPGAEPTSPTSPVASAARPLVECSAYTFDAIDVDADGTITYAEAEEARESMRRDVTGVSVMPRCPLQPKVRGPARGSRTQLCARTPDAAQHASSLARRWLCRGEGVRAAAAALRCGCGVDARQEPPVRCARGAAHAPPCDAIRAG